MDFLEEHARRMGYLFYIVNPNSTAFETVEETPDYITMVVPHFMTLLLLETIILRFRSHDPIKLRLGDAFTSVGHGLVYNVVSSITRGVELVGYQWLYDRRFLNLSWNSPVTWWVAAVGADFIYYFVHRCVHEVSIGWASHQVHHSSEEYNLATALRQSIFQKFFGFGFYLPLACMGVPLPAILVHFQFNLLYQFWIHTEVVSTLGPFEWILNTPSHHRVHHGSNAWCLDKNYGGVFIIWDRMFGTFEPERKGEKIVYGLVDQPQTYNILWLQVFYYRDTFKRAANQATWGDAARCLLYGPGWTPGAPRLGHPMPDDDPTTPPRQKYNPTLPSHVELYLVGHFAVMLFLQQTVIQNLDNRAWWWSLLHIVFLLAGLWNVGAMYDGWHGAAAFEVARCAAFFAVTLNYAIFTNSLINTAVTWYCGASAAAWTLQLLINIRRNANQGMERRKIRNKIK